MKTAIIGSRTLQIENSGQYLPRETTEIISGGAKGIDMCAKTYAEKNQIKFTEYLHIIAHADLILAFWDGRSRGTAYVIEQCRRQNKPIQVYIFSEKG